MSKLIALGVAAIVVGTSVVAWSKSHGTRADAIPAVSTFSVTEIHRGIDVRGLPETEMHDMTFVFVGNE